MNLSLRPATPADLRDVVALTECAIRISNATDYSVREQMAVMADYSLPAMTRRLARAFRFTVATMAMNDTGPRIVGVLVAVPALRGRGRVVIEAMFVDPAAQGMGVGTALVDELVAGAALRGMERIIVAASLTALGFYRRCGFEPVGAGVSDAGVHIIDMWRDLA